MGDVNNRGSKDRPMWYCRYIDSDGKRKHRPTHQPTKALAMRFLAEVEARVARGLVGFPEAAAPERQGRALTPDDRPAADTADGARGLPEP